ncbi:MAG: ROK family transcriptional regulator [Pseudomonadota bacterium]
MAPETMENTTHALEQRLSARRVVLDAIRAGDGLARVDIAERVGLSPASVTAITAEMLSAGLITTVESAGQGECGDKPRRGRPRVALKVRGDACRVAGLKIARESISAVVVDFEGRDTVSLVTQLDSPCLPPDDLSAAAAAVLDGVCAKGGFTRDELDGVGIGLAGLIDARRGFVHWSPSLDRRNVAFSDNLRAEMRCPVFLDNDANLIAKAEQLFGLGRGVANFVVLTVEHGVGMGVVIDHQIYRGVRGCGAEFGHTKVQLEGALCQCGQRGCLEAYVGDYALLREARIGQSDVQSLPDLWQAAQRGDAVAQAVFARAGRMFALGLANVVNIFDPQLVILAGQRASFDHLDAQNAIAEMRSHVVQVDTADTEVAVHQWGDLMWAKGAAAYAIDGVSVLRIQELGAHAE